ncbi:MAG TPA: polysaccharide biosynthesis/export family protein [Lacipirellulaceae bacterium]
MFTRGAWLPTFCLLLLLAGSQGCHWVYPGRNPHGPEPCIPPEVPRELSKTTLPDYIIEPPDVLSIEAISLVPKSPYQLRPLDAVTVIVTGVDEAANISGQYIVQPNGNLQLLPAGGAPPAASELAALPAAGRTVEEIQTTLQATLARLYEKPQVWVTLAQLAAQQQIIGEHLVAPDGKVNLGTYGRVRIVGMTIEEARAAIEAHLSQYLQDPQIAVDVLGYNSKVYYVVTQGAGLGDRVVILPAKGNETILDAIGQIQGLESNQSTRMWVARPGTNECHGDQILPIDWLAVTQRGDTTTNYQLLPGDRLYVSEDKLVAVDTQLGKIISPMERILGFTALGTSTVQNLVFFKQQGQRGFQGGF